MQCSRSGVDLQISGRDRWSFGNETIGSADGDPFGDPVYPADHVHVFCIWNDPGAGLFSGSVIQRNEVFSGQEEKGSAPVCTPDRIGNSAKIQLSDLSDRNGDLWSVGRDQRKEILYICSACSSYRLFPVFFGGCKKCYKTCDRLFAGPGIQFLELDCYGPSGRKTCTGMVQRIQFRNLY